MPILTHTCAQCGQEFRRPHDEKPKYCSSRCYGDAITQDVTARFWRYVTKTEDCWLWTGSKVATGHGHFLVKRRTMGAHRYSWELVHPPIPEGMQVCHNCPGGDNPSCVNPAHLFLGTQRDNIHDMVRKGRWDGGGPPGEGAGRAVLTDDAVREIRSAYAAGGVSMRSLALRFNVAHSTLKAVVQRRTWRHIA